MSRSADSPTDEYDKRIRRGNRSACFLAADWRCRLSRREMLRARRRRFRRRGAGGTRPSSGRAPAACEQPRRQPGTNPLAPRPPHFPAKAKQVIFLYMDGGPSQVDTFDPKPRLTGRARPAVQDEDRADAVQQQRQHARLALGSSASTARAASGQRPVSARRPARRRPGRRPLDDVEVLRAHERQLLPAHRLGPAGPAEHGGLVRLRPGQRVPGPARLRRPQRRPDSARRARQFQQRLSAGHVIRARSSSPATRRWPTSSRREATPGLQQNKLALLRKLDPAVLERLGRVDEVESAIANYELAYRMQIGRAGADRLRRRDAGHAGSSTASMPSSRRRAIFARQCLLARRLVERGVRFIELTCPRRAATAGTSTANLKKGHENNALAVDQPIAALLTDLKQRGLLDETLVVWAGEFGRTPFAQGSDGRDHNPFGFTHLAGRRRRQGRHDLRRRPTNTATRSSRTKSRSTTCTPRCCTCWASTTSG